jgi:ketosteroid isomerase-like protein
MKTALELLHAYLDNIQDAGVSSSLFAEDGALELPYLATVGLPARAEGPKEIKKFLEWVLSSFPDFKFHDLKIFIDTPNKVFAEYEVTTPVAATGKEYHQLYMGRLVAENGKIKLLREGLDTALVTKAFSSDPV